MTRTRYVKPLLRVYAIRTAGMVATSGTLPDEERDNFVVGAREEGFWEEDEK